MNGLSLRSFRDWWHGPSKSPKVPSAPASGFDAFISYRHVEPDQTIARALHELIETYRAPASKRFKGPTAPPLRVFIDTGEAVAGDLPTQVRTALDAARYLVVVCSPRINDEQKPWVEHEVSEFIRLRDGNVDRVLPLLIEGTAETSFPRALLEHVSGPLQESIGRAVVTHLGANIVGPDGKASLKLLRQEKLRLLAPLLDTPYSLLANREVARQRRRRARLGIAAVAVAGAITALFPPRVVPSVIEEQAPVGKWITNLNGHTAVLLTESGTIHVLQSRLGWAGKQALSGEYKKATISDDGRWIVALSRGNRVVVASVDSPSSPRVSSTLQFDVMDPTGAPSDDYGFMSVSADGQWIAALLGASVYLWHPKDNPSATPYLQAGPLPPNTRLVAQLTPAGEFIVISEVPRGRVFVGRPNESVPPALLTRQAVDGVEIGASGTLLAYMTTEQDVNVCKLTAGQSAACEVRRIPRRATAPPPGAGMYPSIEISADDRWILAKRMGGAVFVSRVLEKQPTFRRVVPGGVGSDGRVSSKTPICDSSEWAATLARDSELFVWQLGSETAQAGLPAGRGTSLAQFSPDCGKIVTADNEGTVFVLSVGQTREPPRAFSDGAPFGSFLQTWGTFRWSVDSQSIYAFDQNQVLWGALGDRMRLVTTVKSEIHDLMLTSDNTELYVLSNGRVLRVRRALRVWGVPVWWPTWPEMKRVRGSLHGFDSTSGTGAGKFPDPD